MAHNIDRTQVGFAGEMENYEFPSGETVFNENEQMNLAAELMEVSSEQELEYFLGDLFKKAGSAVGSFINSSTGQALGGLLKGAAKQLLPMAGQALGGYLGGPTGAQIGGQLAQQASGMFEAENEEHEWEAANTFVKLAGEAAKNAAKSPATGDPQAIARTALIEAAKIHAPEFVKSFANGASRPEVGGASSTDKKTGRWVRHGQRIILLGV
ncbi:hypothetical protein [Tunturiibacter gelidiferens]|jgi:hypothetical protein|uniref:hypothetical protein n=1 Tax=Tunturiibacter gelidiferens TaxID=3069689 RepID=UPI003D9BF6AA